jgi:tetratricopeptide (TPR) repeat protein
MLVLALASPARADQWVSPTKVTLTSPNKKWTAVIEPATDGHSGAKATIGPIGGATTTIALRSKWMPVDSFLLDDGTLLTLDHWHRLGYDDVAQFYERDGKLRWSKTLVDLIGQSVVDAADHSVSSIWWRRIPPEWVLAKDGKSVSITMFDENKLQIAFKDGSTVIQMIGTLPDDPVRQLNRARVLARQPGQEPAALAILETMLAKDSEHYEAANLYIEVAQRTNDHARAVAMLDKIAPTWKRTDGGYSLANVTVVWATSLVAVSRLADAERVLRQGAAAAPTYPNPVMALAKLLYDSKRGTDADKVLNEFVTRLSKASYVDSYGIASIGDFYRQRKDLPKALASYLKGYKKTEVTNQFLYKSLVEVSEELGKLDQAIAIQTQLVAYFKQHKMDGKEAEATLTRLRAKR